MGYLEIEQEIMESLYLETGTEEGVTEALEEGDFYGNSEIADYEQEVEESYTTSVNER